MDDFEAVCEIYKLTSENGDGDIYVWVFADDQSLTEFWAREVADRLDNWLEDPGDWVETLRRDENEFMDRWTDKYREWWSTSTDVVLRHVDAAKALKEVVDEGRD